MGKQSADQCLADMLTNIESARQFLGSISYEAFQEDYEKYNAVVHVLQNASEASRRLNRDWPDVMARLEAVYPEVRWQAMHDFSNLTRHEYERIDPYEVWTELQEDGAITLTERALRSEVPFSEIPPQVVTQPSRRVNKPVLDAAWNRARVLDEPLRTVEELRAALEGVTQNVQQYSREEHTQAYDLLEQLRERPAQERIPMLSSDKQQAMTLGAIRAAVERHVAEKAPPEQTPLERDIEP